MPRKKQRGQSSHCFAWSRLCCKEPDHNKDDDDTWMEPIPRRGPHFVPPSEDDGAVVAGEEGRASKTADWEGVVVGDERASVKSVSWAVMLDDLDQMDIRELDGIDDSGRDKKLQVSVNSFNSCDRRRGSSSMGMASMRSLFSEDSVMRHARESEIRPSKSSGPKMLGKISFCRFGSLLSSFDDGRRGSSEFSIDESEEAKFSNSDEGKEESDDESEDGTKTTLSTALTSETDEDSVSIKKTEKLKAKNDSKTQSDRVL